MSPRLILFLAVFLLNVIPAFAPPTWMLFSFLGFRFPSHIDCTHRGDRCGDREVGARKIVSHDRSQTLAQRGGKEQCRFSQTEVGETADTDIWTFSVLRLHASAFEFPFHRLRIDDYAAHPPYSAFSNRPFRQLLLLDHELNGRVAKTRTRRHRCDGLLQRLLCFDTTRAFGSCLCLYSGRLEPPSAGKKMEVAVEVDCELTDIVPDKTRIRNAKAGNVNGRD